MIKLTTINSKKPNAPKLFLVSGGPGLSSLTLRSLDILERNFDLIYVDFPGTNDNPYLGKKLFEELSSELTKIVNNVQGKNYILGHSFGGFFAVNTMINSNADGVICISTPFSQKSLLEVNQNYVANMTPELFNAEKVWIKNQDDASFSKWLSSYESLYFVNPEGENLLLKDKVSANFFKDNRQDAMNKDLILSDLKKANGKKIFICGEEDKLLPPNILKKDAEYGGFDFFTIPNASHFVSFDQPELAAQLIEAQILKS